jgi:hypothetical protein
MRSLAFSLLLVLPVCAQDSSSSLGEAARRAKQNKPGAKAKVQITEENLSTRSSVFPAIHPELDNSEEIAKAMIAYRASHTPKETEDAIHEWYDLYDLRMANAIHEQKDIQDRRTQRSMNSEEMYESSPQDYRKYQALRRAEYRSAVSDEQSMRTNGLLVAKTQQTFEKVRSQLRRVNMNYDWFKIRFGNGNGSW